MCRVKDGPLRRRATGAGKRSAIGRPATFPSPLGAGDVVSPDGRREDAVVGQAVVTVHVPVPDATPVTRRPAQTAPGPVQIPVVGEAFRGAPGHVGDPVGHPKRRRPAVR